MSSSNSNAVFHLCIFCIKAINMVHLSPLGGHVFLCCCYELQPLAVLQGKLHEPSTKVTPIYGAHIFSRLSMLVDKLVMKKITLSKWFL